MFGHYISRVRRGRMVIDYVGNKIFPRVKDIGSVKFHKSILDKRLRDIARRDGFYHLHKIDNSLFFAAVDFFRNLGAEWCNLPLTTLMISSPGGVYVGKKLDYATDALPVEISWFNNKRKIFLSESSQFYLELRLLIDKIDKVFSIYNSFRKEKTDFCHLSEFQHIEFEGKVSFEMNISIFLNLIRSITAYIVRNNRADLLYFLDEKEANYLLHAFDADKIQRITFKNALDLLSKSTRDPRYQEFTLKHFGAWEEIKLTELLNGHVIITEFPALQIPFYHNIRRKAEDDIFLAENADLILYGYREVVGSGTRVSDLGLLMRKAKIFNLPLKDYEPYFQCRRYAQYTRTSGFGLGWQRYIHWLLKLPYIWEATHIPRGHYLPKP